MKIEENNNSDPECGNHFQIVQIERTMKESGEESKKKGGCYAVLCYLEHSY
jgi:hypothetical protein